VSEGLGELVEMPRTIRMTPELWNPTSRKARDVGHPRRGFGCADTQGPSTSLGMTGFGTGDRAAEGLEERRERAE
jgi:hypothetical protein